MRTASRKKSPSLRQTRRARWSWSWRRSNGDGGDDAFCRPQRRRAAFPWPKSVPVYLSSLSGRSRWWSRRHCLRLRLRLRRRRRRRLQPYLMRQPPTSLRRRRLTRWWIALPPRPPRRLTNPGRPCRCWTCPRCHSAAQPPRSPPRRRPAKLSPLRIRSGLPLGGGGEKQETICPDYLSVLLTTYGAGANRVKLTLRANLPPRLT